MEEMILLDIDWGNETFIGYLSFPLVKIVLGLLTCNIKTVFRFAEEISHSFEFICRNEGYQRSYCTVSLLLATCIVILNVVFWLAMVCSAGDGFRV